MNSNIGRGIFDSEFSVQLRHVCSTIADDTMTAVRQFAATQSGLQNEPCLSPSHFAISSAFGGHVLNFLRPLQNMSESVAVQEELKKIKESYPRFDILVRRIAVYYIKKLYEGTTPQNIKLQIPRPIEFYIEFIKQLTLSDICTTIRYWHCVGLEKSHLIEECIRKTLEEFYKGKLPVIDNSDTKTDQLTVENVLKHTSQQSPYISSFHKMAATAGGGEGRGVVSSVHPQPDNPKLFENTDPPNADQQQNNPASQLSQPRTQVPSSPPSPSKQQSQPPTASRTQRTTHTRKSENHKNATINRTPRTSRALRTPRVPVVDSKKQTETPGIEIEIDTPLATNNSQLNTQRTSSTRYSSPSSSYQSPFRTPRTPVTSRTRRTSHTPRTKQGTRNNKEQRSALFFSPRTAVRE